MEGIHAVHVGVPHDNSVYDMYSTAASSLTRKAFEFTIAARAISAITLVFIAVRDSYE